MTSTQTPLHEGKAERLFETENPVTGKKLDKDRFRQNLGDVMENYAKILSRAEHAVGS